MLPSAARMLSLWAIPLRSPLAQYPTGWLPPMTSTFAVMILMFAPRPTGSQGPDMRGSRSRGGWESRSAPHGREMPISAAMRAIRRLLQRSIRRRRSSGDRGAGHRTEGTDLADKERVLGADRPDTQTAGEALAQWRAKGKRWGGLFLDVTGGGSERQESFLVQAGQRSARIITRRAPCQPVGWIPSAFASHSGIKDRTKNSGNYSRRLCRRHI